MFPSFITPPWKPVFEKKKCVFSANKYFCPTYVSNKTIILYCYHLLQICCNDIHVALFISDDNCTWADKHEKFSLILILSENDT